MKREGFIVLTLAFRQEKDRWLARCEELSTSTFGDTFEEAQEALTEAVSLHLNTLEDVGERQRFFREHRIKFYRVKPPQKSTTRIPVDKRIVYQRVAQPVFQVAAG